MLKALFKAAYVVVEFMEYLLWVAYYEPRGHQWYEVDNPLIDRLESAIRWLEYRTARKYHVVRCNNKPGYSDVTYRMLHANFELLRHYVEEEMGGRQGVIERIEHFKGMDEEDHALDWDCMVGFYEEVVVLYDWWNNFHEEIYYDDSSDEVQDMLERLVKIRRGLWT